MTKAAAIMEKISYIEQLEKEAAFKMPKINVRKLNKVVDKAGNAAGKVVRGTVATALAVGTAALSPFGAPITQALINPVPKEIVTRAANSEKMWHTVDSLRSAARHNYVQHGSDSAVVKAIKATMAKADSIEKAIPLK